MCDYVIWSCISYIVTVRERSGESQVVWVIAERMAWHQYRLPEEPIEMSPGKGYIREESQYLLHRLELFWQAVSFHERILKHGRRVT